MEHQGYIKLYRKLLENPISYNIELLGFLVYLLLEVNHTEQEIYKLNQKIKLNPGERIVSQRQLAERFGVSISKIHRFIKILEDEKIVEHEGSNNFTIVKLLNWDSYNGSETRKERQKKTNETPTETKQEGKEYKEGKEIISKDTEQAPILSEETSRDIETTKKEYGNADINKILLLLKNTVGCDDFSESKEWQRKYGKHFLTLGSKIGNTEFSARLKGILSDDFKAKNCNSLKYLYSQMKSYIHSPIVSNTPKVW